MDANHVIVAKTFEEEVKNSTKKNMEKQQTRKGQMCLGVQFQISLLCHILSKRMMCNRKNFSKSLVFGL